MSVPEPSLPAHRRAWLESLRVSLERRRGEGLWREMRPLASAPGAVVRMEGREFLQFSSNNYLGLATDPEVIEAAREATGRLGTGSGASRLVAGSLELHHKLEAALARWKKTEAALLFPSGFMANLAALTTFAGAGDLVVSDKLNHASLLDAAKFSGAGHRTFPHRRYARAADLLGRVDGAEGHRFLVTDGVFSMDGDVADLRAASAVANEQQAMIILDDAHGTGVLGETGAGLAELQGVEGEMAMTVGTLSKALGSLGGFIAGSRTVVESLVNGARAFIYTTALPPACAAAALAAVRMTQREPARRGRVLALGERVRRELRGMGFACGDSVTAIVPVMLGSAERALKASAFLWERGLFIPAIRPPTVAPGTARLRISLMATHTDGQVERLLEGMGALRERFAGGDGGAQ